MVKKIVLIAAMLIGLFKEVGAQGPQQMFHALNKNNFLLDQFPNLATSVGYSVRKLKRAYTGFSMRVRRSGGPSGSGTPEADIAFDASNVVSDNSMLTITKSGGGYSVGDKVLFSTFYNGRNIFVTIWYDQSGAGNNAVQNTSANQPQLVNAGTLITENGVATVEFKDSHTEIRLTLNTPVSLTNGTLFGVCRVVTPFTTAGIADNGLYSYNLNTFNNTGKIGTTTYGVADVPSTVSYATAGIDAVSWSKSSSASSVEINTRISSGTSANNIPISVSQVYGNSLDGTVVRISEMILMGYTSATVRSAVFTNQRLIFKTL